MQVAIFSFFKRNWIHFAAIGIFLVVVMAYFSPQLGGMALKQHDIEQHKGMSHEIADFREHNNGQEPLWTNSMFGGMPATQVSLIHDGNWFSSLTTAYIKVFPSPLGVVLLYMLCFYIMLAMMRVNNWIAIFGSIAYAFLSYQIVILQAGHNSKAVAVAFMAPVVGAFFMAFRRSWLYGGILSALFMSFEMAANHLQVTYYLLFLMLGLGIAELIRVFKTKEFVAFAKASLGIIAAYLLAFTINYGNIGMTNAYAKHSIRGGNDLTKTAEGVADSRATENGLDKDYITEYSYGIDESFTFLSPYIKGGASGKIGDSPFADKVAEDESIDPAYLTSILSVKEGEGVNAYWGNQSSTSGPVYLGVILVFLALLGLVYVKDTSKWALLGVTILTLMLSWGKNYMGLTEWFLEHVPAYNKFRAVTIILVIIELTVPLLAILFLDKLVKEKDAIKQNLKPFYITAGAFLIFLIGMRAVGIDSAYLSDQEKDVTALEAQLDQQRPAILSQIMQLTPDQAKQYGIDVTNQASINAAVDSQIESMRTNYNAQMTATQAARKVIFNASMNRSILFSVLGIGALFLFFSTSLPTAVSLGALGVFAVLDVVTVSTNYLNNDDDVNGVEHGKYWASKMLELYPMSPELGDYQILEQEIAASPMVKKAVADGKREGIVKANEMEAVGPEKSRIIDAYTFSALNRATNYRVFERTSGAFNSTRASYFHKSLGGYHGAKLRSIQNMIEFHIGSSNNNVLNMFNVKYILVPDSTGLVANPNPMACGNAWFVKRAQVVATPDEEIRALGAKFSLSNIGKGRFFVNGVLKSTAFAYGSEKLQYLPEGKNDTLTVPLSNGIPVGVDVVFVSDRNGKTDLIMKQGFDRDSTKSMIGMVALKVVDEFSPKEEAIVTTAEATKLKGRQWNGEGSILLTHYAPNKLTYTSNSKTGGFAVFSEVYYADGWKATIDGKPADIVKVNYMLRGLNLPAGNHKVEFDYIDEQYNSYNSISLIGSVVMFLISIGGLFYYMRTSRKTSTL